MVTTVSPSEMDAEHQCVHPYQLIARLPHQKIQLAYPHRRTDSVPHFYFSPSYLFLFYVSHIRRIDTFINQKYKSKSSYRNTNVLCRIK